MIWGRYKWRNVHPEVCNVLTLRLLIELRVKSPCFPCFDCGIIWSAYPLPQESFWREACLFPMISFFNYGLRSNHSALLWCFLTADFTQIMNDCVRWAWVIMVMYLALLFWEMVLHLVLMIFSFLDATYEEMKTALLQQPECRYAACDLEFEHNGQLKSKLAFISW